MYMHWSLLNDYLLTDGLWQTLAYSENYDDGKRKKPLTSSIHVSTFGLWRFTTSRIEVAPNRPQHLSALLRLHCLENFILESRIQIRGCECLSAFCLLKNGADNSVWLWHRFLNTPKLEKSTKINANLPLEPHQGIRRLCRPCKQYTDEAFSAISCRWSITRYGPWWQTSFWNEFGGRKEDTFYSISY